MRRSTASALLAAAVMVVGSLEAAVPAAADTAEPGNPVVLVSGLNNPRQLVLLGGRSLLVAEAGRGGDDCVDDVGCVGATGSVGLVRDVWAGSPTLQRPLTGLLSAAAEDGGFAVGSDGVGSRNLNLIYVAMVGAAAPDLAARRNGNHFAQAGKLLLGWHGHLRTAADISAVEAELDPDEQGVDSNPYSVLVLPSGQQLVADAAGNDILKVTGSTVSVFAVLPNHDGHQPVPTALALGPDGSIYVGELNGENPGTARVWRLSRSGEIISWITGFTTITGLAVGPTGDLYVSELFGGESIFPGQVTVVHRNSSRVHYPVPFPAGVAVDLHRHVYVAAWSISDSDGSALGGGITAPPGAIWRLTTS